MERRLVPIAQVTHRSSALKPLLVNLSLAMPSLKLVNLVVPYLQLVLVPAVRRSLVVTFAAPATTLARSVDRSDSNAWI